MFFSFDICFQCDSKLRLLIFCADEKIKAFTSLFSGQHVVRESAGRELFVVTGPVEATHGPDRGRAADYKGRISVHCCHQKIRDVPLWWSHPQSALRPHRRSLLRQQVSIMSSIYDMMHGMTEISID